MAKNPLAKLTGAVNAAIRAHLEWIFRVTTTRPALVAALTSLLCLLALLSIASTRFESDIFKLFPARQGALRLLLDSLEWTGSAKEVYFLLEGDKGTLPAEAEAFAGRLKGLTVDGMPAFSRVTYRVYDPAEAAAFASFIGYAVTHPQLFLPPADLGRFAERFAIPAMGRSLARAQAELASQAGIGTRDIIAADPLYLRELILPRLTKGSQSLDLDPSSPYFLSRDGRVLIIIAEPARPVQDMAFARKLVAGISRARQGAGATISCAGAHLSAVIDEREVKGNVIACVLSSLAVVLLLFYLTYRRFLPTLLIPLILFCGVVLALGTAGLFLSSVSLISFAFTALIIGLGTDYSIHLYDRFYWERGKGRPAGEALRLAVIDTGHGVFTAATTTALPFLALTVSDVRALFELGLLVGLGVIFSMYATFFFLPPLLLFAERRYPDAVYRPLPRFGLGRLWDLGRSHCRPVIALSFLAVLLLFIAAFRISFESELKNLQPRHSEAFLTQEKIERHLSISPRQMLVSLDGEHLEELMARGRMVEELAERYRQRGGLTAWSSLGQVLNDPATQRAIGARLAADFSSIDPGRGVRGSLESAGFAPAAFAPFIAGAAALPRLQPVSPAEAVERLAASPLRGVAARHLVESGGRYHLLFYIYYGGAHQFDQHAFLRDLAAMDPAARATSQELVGAQLLDSVKRSFLWGFIIGGMLVLFLLLAHFDTAEGIFHSLFPVTAGVIAMLGVMALAGMKLNFMNAMVLVTILGMGSDYGLHIAHRVGERHGEEGGAAFVQAGRAVFLSAVTTIAGFGSLAFTDYGALASIGWATNCGVGATALFTLAALPAFVALFRKRRSAA
ncbi:MAG TPA: MMPL family transporter [Geobacteraceae bacterium]